MQNKLQELTDKLYNEGLSKGKQEAEEIKATAQKEADAIISQANQKAKEILDAANKQADELKTKSENDIKMAANQSFSALKQQIENLIVSKAISKPLTEGLSDTAFLESIISIISKAFNPNSSDGVSLTIILPEQKKSELDQFMQNQIKAICAAGLDVQYSKNITNGFRVSPKNEGYIISFTDEDFNALLSEYLRPKTRTLLFGE